ncbi:uncharacterized protein HMPREF1541_02552 [Cyphellophora europaea CBS 101466]|uniref:F-box domain-containing protein n=1 Tax=Cyphellophora europaea (strain CBS 101466) TaxID=1220924 RepID=W2S5U9_CYPE1|nr:uncharacterized protein HMPREF1541_02552 [Cyphellophora europaea CBS 101466]ETN43393.1 hypothetical protein HMPREF1541_02552 [Cyphellophora europaea CBS 101466]
MKPASELAAPRRLTRQKERALHSRYQELSTTRPLDRTPSGLECLPTEIIQHIFFDSLETNLALTSRTLNHKLSNEAVFRSLLLLAFFDSDQNEDEASVEEKHFLPAKYRYLDGKQRANLQLKLFRFRWCTRSRIDGCMPTLSRLSMVQAWHSDKLDEQIHGPAPSETDTELTPSLPDIDDQAAMDEYFCALKTSKLYERLRTSCDRPLTDQTGDHDTLPFIRISVTEYRGRKVKVRKHLHPVLGALAIPDYLLDDTSWTDEKLSFLQLLQQGLACSVHYHAPMFSLDALFKGMESAINGRNLDALFALSNLFSQIVTSGWLDPNDRWQTPRGTHNDLRLPVRLFHLAAKMETASAEFLRLLIRADVKAIPQDDSVLTAWAIRADRAEHPLGTWLLRLLEGSSEVGNVEWPFVRGAICTSWKYNDNIFDENRTFADDQGYITDTALRCLCKTDR